MEVALVVRRVFGLAKERLNGGCSGGSQGVRRRSGLEGIALGVEKRLRWR
jgi:hypothetical protein